MPLSLLNTHKQIKDKLSILKVATKIYFLKDGKLIEMETYEELKEPIEYIS